MLKNYHILRKRSVLDRQKYPLALTPASCVCEFGFFFFSFLHFLWHFSFFHKPHHRLSTKAYKQKSFSPCPRLFPLPQPKKFPLEINLSREDYAVSDCCLAHGYRRCVWILDLKNTHVPSSTFQAAAAVITDVPLLFWISLVSFFIPFILLFLPVHSACMALLLPKVVAQM